MPKTILVCGAGGFIGSHLIRRLKTFNDDVTVVGVDLKRPEYLEGYADKFLIDDLKDQNIWKSISTIWDFDEVYQLAADMGGVEYINSGDHDPEVMINSVQINVHAANFSDRFGKIFFSSSACVYNEANQEDPNNPICAEGSEYPAYPDSEYGWEKLFSERLYQAPARNHGTDVRIARFHNIYGEEGNWRGGKEKAPAAICRKVASAEPVGEVEIFGDGKQTRTFLHIEDALNGVERLMESIYDKPVNIGSEEVVTIDELVKIVAVIAGKAITVSHVLGPTGVRGRVSDNTLVTRMTGWQQMISLREGMRRTYRWINQQLSLSASL